MSENKKSLTDLVPDSIDNAVKNITDKPTQNIGTTLADIWYLVFGGISQAAEKRKLKYSYALQEFEKELKEKISKIPEDKLIDPDIQMVAKALEEAKYCIDKEELRKLFVNLITKSLNKESTKYAHPIFIDIIKNLSSLDALVLNSIYKYQKDSLLFIDIEDEALLFSLSVLENQGLILTNLKPRLHSHSRILICDDTLQNSAPIVSENKDSKRTISIELTQLGEIFCDTCI